MEIEEQSICIDCGLCCDGTMFHAIDLESSDDLDPLRIRGAVLISDGGSRRFQQPCPAFDGTCCSVYEARPSSCRSYVCGLLESVTNGGTSLTAARQTIERAKKLASVVRERLDLSVETDVIHLGRHGLSTYLGVMKNQYEPDRLAVAFPEAAELIDVLQQDFGWINRVIGQRPADSGQ
jgi:Fe-S-cluster containining protein